MTTTYTLANGAATTAQAEAIYNQVRTEDGKLITQQVAVFNQTMWMNGVGTVHVMTTTPISTCRPSGEPTWPEGYDGPLETGVSMYVGGNETTSGAIGSADVSYLSTASVPATAFTASTPAIASLSIRPTLGSYPIVASIPTTDPYHSGGSTPTIASSTVLPSRSWTVSNCPIPSPLYLPAGHVTATSAAGIGVGSALVGALIPALVACLLRKRFSLRYRRKKRPEEMEDVRYGVVGKLAKETSRLATIPLQGRSIDLDCIETAQIP